MASRSISSVSISVAGHLLVGAAVVLLPIFWPAELPPPEGVRAVLLGPAPPPPPPLAFGSPEAKPRPERATRSTQQKPKPVQDPTAAAFTAPETVEPLPPVEPIPAEEPAAAMEMAGSPDGKIGGNPQGVIDGVDGGVVGGVRDGTLGGDLWGTGDEVIAYDIPPRLLWQPRPVYPADAAVKRIEGTVVVDVWIGRDGRVQDARVVESIQLLDQEALRTVRTWEFAPAKKRGIAVPSMARAEVKFTLL